jgi:hypothetical protein
MCPTATEFLLLRLDCLHLLQIHRCSCKSLMRRPLPVSLVSDVVLLRRDLLVQVHLVLLRACPARVSR